MDNAVEPKKFCKLNLHNKFIYYFYVPDNPHNQLCFFAQDGRSHSRLNGNRQDGLFVSEIEVPSSHRAFFISKKEEFERKYSGKFYRFTLEDFEE